MKEASKMIKDLGKYTSMKDVITQVYKEHPFITLQVFYKDEDNNDGQGIIFCKPSGFAIHTVDGELHSLLDQVRKYEYIDGEYKKLVVYR